MSLPEADIFSDEAQDLIRFRFGSSEVGLGLFSLSVGLGSVVEVETAPRVGMQTMRPRDLGSVGFIGLLILWFAGLGIMSNVTSETSELSLHINHAFDFMERRERVIAEVIASHRSEFGQTVVQSSIDAICLSMVSLAALAEYRYEAEVGKGKYPEQFCKLLKNYCGAVFSDRISIPELLQDPRAMERAPDIVAAVRGRYSLPMGGYLYRPTDDPSLDQVEAFLSGTEITIPPGMLAKYEHSRLIYTKYRNPVVHTLEIADGNEPCNMWHERPGIFYENRIKPPQGPLPESIRLFGVTDDFVLALLHETIVCLRSWCLKDGKYIFATPWRV